MFSMIIGLAQDTASNKEDAPWVTIIIAVLAAIGAIGGPFFLYKSNKSNKRREEKTATKIDEAIGIPNGKGSLMNQTSDLIHTQGIIQQNIFEISEKLNNFIVDDYKLHTKIDAFILKQTQDKNDTIKRLDEIDSKLDIFDKKLFMVEHIVPIVKEIVPIVEEITPVVRQLAPTLKTNPPRKKE